VRFDFGTRNSMRLLAPEVGGTVDSQWIAKISWTGDLTDIWGGPAVCDHPSYYGVIAKPPDMSVRLGWKVRPIIVNVIRHRMHGDTGCTPHQKSPSCLKS
jgi:hypothetical protein